MLSVAQIMHAHAHNTETHRPILSLSPSHHFRIKISFWFSTLFSFCILSMVCSVSCLLLLRVAPRCLNVVVFFFSHKIETKAIIKKRKLTSITILVHNYNSDKSHLRPRKKMLPSTAWKCTSNAIYLWVVSLPHQVRTWTLLVIIVKLVRLRCDVEMGPVFFWYMRSAHLTCMPFT